MPAPSVLAPLLDPERLPAEEDASMVRAMAVILRIERDSPPSRTDVLEAAATAAVAVCLDDRARPGGEWHPAVEAWVDGRIRKLTRRARGAHWTAVQALPGLTVQVGGASVRALVPGLVAQTPREVSRLQISGTELPLDDPGPAPDGVPVIWLNPTLTLTVGKAAAQVGHASMLLAAVLSADRLARWTAGGLPCAVRKASTSRWRALDAQVRAGRAVVVRDAGFTEIEPGSVTCVAHWA